MSRLAALVVAACFFGVYGFRLPYLGQQLPLHGRTPSAYPSVATHANHRDDLGAEPASQEPCISSSASPEPVVAIVGRANVGKSSLFNRISKQVRKQQLTCVHFGVLVPPEIGDIFVVLTFRQFHRGSIVSDVPGTTRDRQYALADWEGRSFRLIDTGGFDDENYYAESIKSQVRHSLEEASVVVVVVDGQVGVTEADLEVRNLILSHVKKKRDLIVLLCVNKCESFHFGDVLAEVRSPQFWRLGLGKPYPVSALHGTGLAELLDRCVEEFGKATIEDRHDVVVSFVGRPNCGKSSLVNLLSGSSRCLVSPKEGTTLDTVEVPIVRGEPLTKVTTEDRCRLMQRIDIHPERSH
ncbi:GTP-binding protein engA [Babesia caballi]|uniref:GTP-binding protein engA n=1 Tax=Babesia caballi TaxID=5871 RepID=A0AAV4LXY2_BABCB|nr:GTP-binding protein engA [Babesia caballi]